MDDPLQAERSADDILQIMPQSLFAHLSRVEYYVRMFCQSMAERGYQEIHIKDSLPFGRAAFFHDIGKLCISGSILTKPGKLSPEELLIMQKHPIYAKDILESMKSAPTFSMNPGFFHLTVSAALFHHEWWNGKGYPFGAAGRDIPLIARITSICDAFDAITSGRPYRSARPVDDAFDEIEKYSNTQFDPVLSEFFIRNKNIFSGLTWIPAARPADIDFI